MVPLSAVLLAIACLCKTVTKSVNTVVPAASAGLTQFLRHNRGDVQLRRYMHDVLCRLRCVLCCVQHDYFTNSDVKPCAKKDLPKLPDCHEWTTKKRKQQHQQQHPQQMQHGHPHGGGHMPGYGHPQPGMHLPRLICKFSQAVGTQVSCANHLLFSHCSVPSCSCCAWSVAVNNTAIAHNQIVAHLDNHDDMCWCCRWSHAVWPRQCSHAASVRAATSSSSSSNRVWRPARHATRPRPQRATAAQWGRHACRASGTSSWTGRLQTR